MELKNIMMDIEQSVEVNGSLEEVFDGVIFRLGAGHAGPGGELMGLQIEPYAGGRWFRDRGEGVQHLWGHVQVIKAPVLLELSGPMFMSYPALNHLEVKLEPAGQFTRISLRHRAFGMLEEAHRQGLTEGWKMILERVTNDFPRASSNQA